MTSIASLPKHPGLGLRNSLMGSVLMLLLFSGCQISAQEPQEDPQELKREVKTDMARGRYEQAADNLEKLIAEDDQYVDYFFTLADARFMNAQMPEAIKAYDKSIELQPVLKPRCWQRGLAYYFNDQFKLGKEQFEVHQTVNSQDVENSVWHLLCNSRLVGVDEARKSMIPIRGDQRVPMPEVLEMFAGTGSIEKVLQAATKNSSASGSRRDNQLYYAHLYIGLFHDMNGDTQKARESMTEAVAVNPISKSQLMGSVADVYLRLHDPENRN